MGEKHVWWVCPLGVPAPSWWASFPLLVGKAHTLVRLTVAAHKQAFTPCTLQPSFSCFGPFLTSVCLVL